VSGELYSMQSPSIPTILKLPEPPLSDAMQGIPENPTQVVSDQEDYGTRFA